MNDIDYANAYHEAWEAWLHSRRQNALEAGRPLTNADENRLLSEYLTKNRKVASQPRVCLVCRKAINDAVAAGLDPFAIPNAARELLESFGIKTPRRKR